MQIDLKGKRVCIFGLQGSGKSNLAALILKQYGQSALIYDTLAEYKDELEYWRYVPKNRGDQAELSAIVRLALKTRRWRMIVIDEANRYCPSKPAPLPQAISDLNDWCRHKQYDIIPVYIARRPVQLNQDLTELASHLFIFNLAGKNDVQYLNDLKAGLGDAAQGLKQYHFIVVNERREYQVLKPITKQDMLSH